MSVDSAQSIAYSWSFLSTAELEANSTSLPTFHSLLLSLLILGMFKSIQQKQDEGETKPGDTSHHQKDRKEMDIKFLSYKTSYKRKKGKVNGYFQNLKDTILL